MKKWEEKMDRMGEEMKTLRKEISAIKENQTGILELKNTASNWKCIRWINVGLHSVENNSWIQDVLTEIIQAKTHRENNFLKNSVWHMWDNIKWSNIGVSERNRRERWGRRNTEKKRAKIFLNKNWWRIEAKYPRMLAGV